MKVKKHEDGAVVYDIDSQGRTTTLVRLPTGADERVLERVLAAINGEALDALPQTERVPWWEAFTQGLPLAAWNGQHIYSAARLGRGVVRLSTCGLFPVVTPDDDGTVEVLTEDAS